MFKKVLIIALIAIPVPCSAGKRFNDFCAFIGLGTHPVNPANHILGVASDNAVKIADKAVEIIQSPEEIEKASAAVTSGLAKGPFYAARDGAVYVRDTAAEHPIIAGLAVTAGIAGAAYYKFRPLTEEEVQKAQIEKDRRMAMIREAASIVRADLYAEEYRTCLNRHAYDHGASCSEKIRRCHSPARKLAMEAPERAIKITKAYREYA